MPSSGAVHGKPPPALQCLAGAFPSCLVPAVLCKAPKKPDSSPPGTLSLATEHGNAAFIAGRHRAGCRDVLGAGTGLFYHPKCPALLPCAAPGGPARSQRRVWESCRRSV